MDKVISMPRKYFIELKSVKTKFMESKPFTCQSSKWSFPIIPMSSTKSKNEYRG